MGREGLHDSSLLTHHAVLSRSALSGLKLPCVISVYSTYGLCVDVYSSKNVRIFLYSKNVGIK